MNSISYQITRKQNQELIEKSNVILAKIEMAVKRKNEILKRIKKIK